MLKRLEQANKIWKKRETNESQWQSSLTFDVCNTAADPASNRLWLNLVGQIHEKTKCVFTVRWHRPRLRIKAVPEFNHVWTVFKSNFMALKDQIMQDRINFLVDSEVTSPMRLQSDITSNAMCMFTRNHIFIFDKHELQSLQSLLRNYKSSDPSLVSNIWDQAILHQRYQDTGVWGKIVFHSCPDRNHSDLLYDMGGGGEGRSEYATK